MNNAIDIGSVVQKASVWLNCPDKQASWTLAGKKGRTWIGFVREWIDFLSIDGWSNKSWSWCARINDRSWSLRSISEGSYHVQPFISNVLERIRLLQSQWDEIQWDIFTTKEERFEFLCQLLGYSNGEITKYESFETLLTERFLRCKTFSVLEIAYLFQEYFHSVNLEELESSFFHFSSAVAASGAITLSPEEENIKIVENFIRFCADVTTRLSVDARAQEISSLVQRAVFSRDNLAPPLPKRFEGENSVFHMENIRAFTKLGLFKEKDKIAIQGMINRAKWDPNFFSHKMFMAKFTFFGVLDWTTNEISIRTKLDSRIPMSTMQTVFDDMIKSWTKRSLDISDSGQGEITVEEVIDEFLCLICEELKKSVEDSFQGQAHQKELIEKEKIYAKIKQKLIVTMLQCSVSEQESDRNNQIRELLLYLSRHRAFLAHNLMEKKEVIDFIEANNFSLETRKKFIVQNLKSILTDVFSPGEDETIFIDRWVTNLGKITSIKESVEDFFIDLFGITTSLYTSLCQKNFMCYTEEDLQDTTKLTAFQNSDGRMKLNYCIQTRHELENDLLTARSTDK